MFFKIFRKRSRTVKIRKQSSQLNNLMLKASRDEERDKESNVIDISYVLEIIKLIT